MAWEIAGEASKTATIWRDRNLGVWAVTENKEGRPWTPGSGRILTRKAALQAWREKHKQESPAAAMAKLRWANTTPEERSEHARKMAASRKAGNRPGRPKSDALRCPCGTMTAKRAAARKHVC